MVTRMAAGGSMRSTTAISSTRGLVRGSRRSARSLFSLTSLLHDPTVASRYLLKY